MLAVQSDVIFTLIGELCETIASSLRLTAAQAPTPPRMIYCTLASYLGSVLTVVCY